MTSSTERVTMLSVSLIGFFSLGMQWVRPTPAHEAAMIFLFLLPAPLMIFGRRLFTTAIQADALAWPVLHQIVDSLFLVGGVITVAAMLLQHPSCESIGLTVATLSLWLNALVLLITFHTKRQSAPLMAWSLYAFSATLAIVLPTILAAALGKPEGATWAPDWLTAPPLIYAYLLPSAGIVCSMIARHSQSPFLGHRSTVIAFLATAYLAVFTALARGTGVIESDGLISLLNLFTFVPFSVILLNTVLTLIIGPFERCLSLLHALIVLAVLTLGHLSGLFMAIPGLGQYLQGTWWGMAHLVLLMAGAAIAYQAGIYGAWTEIVGEGRYSGFWAKFSLFILVVSWVLSILPMFVLGGLGIPREMMGSIPWVHALRAFSAETAVFFLVGYSIALLNILIHSGLIRKRLNLLVLLCVTGSVSATTPQESAPAFPEDLGPAFIDVSAYPQDYQQTYRDVFLSFSKFAGGPARLINSPLIEMDAENERRERTANPTLFSEPGIVEVSSTAWKTYVAKIRNRPPCCGACPYLTLAQARDLWSFLVYDSRQRKTGPRAAEWIQHRRELIQKFENKTRQSPKEPQS